MRYPQIQLALLLLARSAFLSAATQPDTALLAQHLKRFRQYKTYEMPASEYKSIQREYLAWITARLKAGANVGAINEELKTAGLFFEAPSTPNDIDGLFESHAGYLREVETRPLQASPEVVTVQFGTYTGSGCNLDDTVALYRRQPFQFLTALNAQRSYTHGYILRDVAVGKVGAQGRLVASAWVASNCTSNWNGETFRIDQFRAGVLEPIVNKGIGAFFDDELRIELDGENVTLHYTSGIRDTTVIVRKAIARYEVHGRRATRVPPIAPSYGGFVDEWLSLDDTEAAHWSSPQASAQHHRVSAKFRMENFTIRSAWNCPGAPSAREIEVESYESKQASVFRISGSTAEQMRMESVLDRPSPSCKPLDIATDLKSIFNEP